MTSEQFCYWLQGYAELQSIPPGYLQWESIKEHLNLVFLKETKSTTTPVSIPLDQSFKQASIPNTSFFPDNMTITC